MSHLERELLILQDYSRIIDWPIDKDIVVQRNAARSLKQGFSMIMEKQVAIHFVQAQRSWTVRRECAQNQVGPITVGAGLIILDKDIVSNDGRGRHDWHPRYGRQRVLILDLHVIPN